MFKHVILFYMSTITTTPRTSLPTIPTTNARPAAERVVGASADATPQPDRTFGTTMSIAIAAMTLVFLLVVGVPYGLHTGSFMSGLGLGAFCAFWGSPGFGTMAGFARWTSTQAKDHA